MSASKNLSIFIPHVFPNFTKDYIADVFDETVGHVHVVDMVAKQDRDGKPFNAVYVHFYLWYDNETATRIQEEIEKDGSSRFYHDDKWYWILLPNKSTRPGDRKLRVNLSDLGCETLDKPVLKRETAFSLEPGVSMDELMEPKEDEEERQLEEVEALMEEDDKHLVSIDSRYVLSLEQENLWLSNEINQLRLALINLDKMYQVESAKARAFQGQF